MPATTQDYENARQVRAPISSILNDKLFETRNEVLYSNALRVLVSINIPVMDSDDCDEFSGTSC